jgi:large subunit ribosomal protein L25
MDQMDKIVIEATRRTVTGKKVGALRRQGILPGVLYGHHIDPTPISMNLHDATKLLSNVSGTTLLTLHLDGREHSALVRERQRDFIKGTLLHVDFQAVSLTEKIRARVTIETEGVAPAVKDLNGTVYQSVNEIEVECLPQDLPSRIVVDVSSLANIGDSILIRDLPIPDNVEVLEDPDEVVVVITAAQEEVEEVPAEAEAEVEEPEVIGRGKKEEEVEEEEEKS